MASSCFLALDLVRGEAWSASGGFGVGLNMY